MHQQHAVVQTRRSAGKQAHGKLLHRQDDLLHPPRKRSVGTHAVLVLVTVPCASVPPPNLQLRKVPSAHACQGRTHRLQTGTDVVHRCS
jgi:hypothetical protein